MNVQSLGEKTKNHQNYTKIIKNTHQNEYFGIFFKNAWKWGKQCKSTLKITKNTLKWSKRLNNWKKIIHTCLIMVEMINKNRKS